MVACLVTLQSVLLVAGAWRNDRQIERNMGVAQAEVLSAGSAALDDRVRHA